MRITISQDDGMVIVDGVAHEVDCSELPRFVRAIQWDSNRGAGHIEMDPDERGVRMGNLTINSIEPWEFLIERWRIASTLKARKERQARIDEVVQEIATRDQVKAHAVAQREAEARASDERRRAAKLAQDERKRVEDAEAKLVELSTRLDELERQVKQDASA